MTPEKAFGLALKAARSKQGFSQEQLALSCNLDRTFISMLERGQRQPSLRSILSISASLEIPPCELVQQTTEIMGENYKSRDSN